MYLWKIINCWLYKTSYSRADTSNQWVRFKNNSGKEIDYFDHVRKECLMYVRLRSAKGHYDLSAGVAREIKNCSTELNISKIFNRQFRVEIWLKEVFWFCRTSSHTFELGYKSTLEWNIKHNVSSQNYAAVDGKMK